jgi:hypothetical protein
MKILYDDESIAISSGDSYNHPKFVLEDDGKTVTFYDRAGNKSNLTKEEYNKFINAVKSGKVSSI